MWRAEDVRGFEEREGETPWCVQCNHFLKWPYHDECIGCLTVGGRPADTVTFRTVHWDTTVLHAVIGRKRAVWEQRHPGWELVPDFTRYWEDATHPSKYVDRETTVGRKLAWTRFRVERRHPRGLWLGLQASHVRLRLPWERYYRRETDGARLLGVDVGAPQHGSTTWLLLPGQGPMRLLDPEEWEQRGERSTTMAEPEEHEEDASPVEPDDVPEPVGPVPSDEPDEDEEREA